MASPGLPALNPPFNLPDFPLLRLPWRTMTEAHLEHPQQAHHGIKGVVPLREATLDFLL